MFNQNDEIKKERVDYILSFFDKLLSKLSDNQIIKGNIILAFHWLIMILYIIFTLFSPLSYINISFVFLLIFLHNSINLYFGSLDKCILVKLERYFYNDKSWYGPNTPFFRFIGMSNRDDQKTIQFYNLSFWILLYIYYFIRIFNNCRQQPNIV